MKVDLTGDFDVDDVLGEIGLDNIIDSYGTKALLTEIGIDYIISESDTGALLDGIGQQEAMDHFGLVEPGENQ